MERTAREGGGEGGMARPSGWDGLKIARNRGSCGSCKHELGHGKRNALLLVRALLPARRTGGSGRILAREGRTRVRLTPMRVPMRRRCHTLAHSRETGDSRNAEDRF